jgi:pimeloyl-ACP methyl ester carboxylesterase
MDDLVVRALGPLVPGVREGELRRDGRTLRWVEAGSGSPAVVLDAALGEPGSLAWAGVMPLVTPGSRMIAYDRAGIGLSDPVSPLTLDAQVGDLAAVARAAGGGCVLVGHSWGGLLAELVAWQHPELVAALVLADPADERFYAELPPDELRRDLAIGDTAVAGYASGNLADLVRDTFGPFVQRLTADQHARAVLLDAYVGSYVTQSQAHMVRDERLMLIDALPLIRERRAAGTMPDVPVVIFSATTGAPPQSRQKWTGLHAQLAGSLPRGTHVVLEDTGHEMNQDRAPQIAEAINRVIDEIRVS